eukprot:1886900-Amphidinium_carterae.2
MATADLPEAFTLANRLIGGDALTTDEVLHILSWLGERLRMTRRLPAALGSAQSSLGHKLKAMTHAERMESASWSQVAHLSTCTFSRTGDFGTESGMSGTVSDIAALQGPWICQQAPCLAWQEDNFHIMLPQQGHVANSEDFEFECLSVGDRAYAGESLSYDLTSELFVPGIMHITHNITGSLHTVLREWTHFTNLLTHVCRLLRNKWSKTRLLNTCFTQQPWAACRSKLDTFSAAVYQGRWGSVTDAIEQILPLFPILKGAWDITRFGSADNTGKEANTGGKTLSVSVVNEAFTEPFFAAYALAMKEIATVLLHVDHWLQPQFPCSCLTLLACNYFPFLQFQTSDVSFLRSEACPCKPRQRWDLHRQQHKLEKLCGKHCPLKGRRAPELAAGAVQELLQDMFNATTGSRMPQNNKKQSRNMNKDKQFFPFLTGLLFQTPEMQALGEDMQQIVLDDVARARQHVVLMFHLKLGCWQQLPYICLGLGHADMEQARTMGKRALELYAASPDHALDEQHPLTLQLCSPGTELNHEFLQFVTGTSDLTNFPSLLSFAGKAKFVPISERWVESLHASTHRTLRSAPRGGPLHIGFDAILPRVHSCLEQSAENVKILGEHCLNTRNIHKAVDAAGLSAHPTVVSAREELGRKDFNAKGFPAAVLSFMHADEKSMYRQIDTDAVEKPRMQQRLQLTHTLQLQSASAADELWATAAFDHLRNLLHEDPKADNRSDLVFSLGPHCDDQQYFQQLLFSTLASATDSSKEPPALEDFDALAINETHCCTVKTLSPQGYQLRAQRALLMFEILLAPEKAMKLPKPLPVLGKNTLLTAQLKILSVAKETESVAASLEPLGITAADYFVWTPAMFPWKEMRTLRAYSMQLCWLACADTPRDTCSSSCFNASATTSL